MDSLKISSLIFMQKTPSILPRIYAHLSYFKGPSIKSISFVNEIVDVDRLAKHNGYTLEFNNFINFTEDMKHSLLCQIKPRVTNIIVDDIQKSLSPSLSHSIIIPE